MKDIKYSEILRVNRELKSNNSAEKYEIKILSNIIVNQISSIIEFPLQKKGINAHASVGNFDNIVQDSVEFNASNCVIVFWELCNVIDGFQYRSNLLDDEQIESIVERMKSEIDYTLNNLAKTPLVVLNEFSTVVFNSHLIKQNAFDKICNQLTHYLKSKITPNVVLIDIDKIFAKLSISACVDFRNYYSSKALYTIDFFKSYALFILPVILSALGKSKKALIFDCDNTLWKGILGEDGENGVEMTSKSPGGVFFEEVQYLAKELSAKGIIIGLNSKNNHDDVSKIIKNNKALSLKESEIVIEKINWNDKVTNLRAIATELNIGLDSIVFVDDSDFEINLVKEYLPEVHTLQVPKSLHEYPNILRENLGLFYSILSTKDDSSRIQSYKEQSLRDEVKRNFDDIIDYLKSLKLEMIIHIDQVSLIERMAQLTQKTNQFNLTTKRYAYTDVENFVNENKFITFAFEVNDRFGNFGITGESFIAMDGHEATIDTFLMSCRVLGRNLELKFLDEIILVLVSKGVKLIKSSYMKTMKNQQVEDFYERAGFKLIDNSGETKTYELNTEHYNKITLDYISVKYER